MEVVNTVIAYTTSTAVLCTACLVAGVVFSQKIKDWVSGTSTEFRAAMTSVEGKAKSDVKTAVAGVFAKIVPAPVVPPTPVALAVITAAVTAPTAPEAPHA